MGYSDRNIIIIIIIIITIIDVLSFLHNMHKISPQFWGHTWLFARMFPVEVLKMNFDCTFSILTLGQLRLTKISVFYFQQSTTTF